uniref:virB8 family protein n=1 Tax=Pararhodobacter sp. TaxID=2127056 RepID=UPI002AFFA107
GLSIVSVVAIAGLTPLKTVEPFVVRVDNSTGIVDVVSGLQRGPAKYDEAVAKWFAARYVRAREGFVASEAEENFRTVALMSAPAEQTRFSAWFAGRNPESPQNVYGNKATVRIRIKTISLLGNDVMQVRYLRIVTRGEEVTQTHWIATLTYSFVSAPMSEQDRLINPLGFIVSEYRADPETVQ